jgi:hypothetical protein
MEFGKSVCFTMQFVFSVTFSRKLTEFGFMCVFESSFRKLTEFRKWDLIFVLITI